MIQNYELIVKGIRNFVNKVTVTLALRDKKRFDGEIFDLDISLDRVEGAALEFYEAAARRSIRQVFLDVAAGLCEGDELLPETRPCSEARYSIKINSSDKSPESFMKRPKRRRWVNEKYTRWVKTQPCACCGKPADDPHHLIGHGQGGMGTKSHDIFTLPLCREHHNELHADPLAFEEKHGSQVDLIFRFLDHAFATGVLG
ncbi:hypothetical protein A1WM_04444 [Escherichia coli KTE101]|nr:hypothetical protein A1WM_04444 [Escherichia coli KTE101]